MLCKIFKIFVKTWSQKKERGRGTRILYMSFDRFLLAVESRDLSQADKSIIRVSDFSIGN